MSVPVRDVDGHGKCLIGGTVLDARIHIGVYTQLIVAVVATTGTRNRCNVITKHSVKVNICRVPGAIFDQCLELRIKGSSNESTVLNLFNAMELGGNRSAIRGILGIHL